MIIRILGSNLGTLYSSILCDIAKRFFAGNFPFIHQNFCILQNDDECQRKLWMETAMERITRAVDASLIALYILTSPNMHKKVYLEDVIDRIIMFAKYQLHNTIYPAYDPVYRTKQKKDISNSRNKKRSNAREVRDKSVVLLYTKLVEVVSLLSELLSIQPLTDNSILHLSTMGVSPFFVEGINELQLNALKLVTSVIYELFSPS